MSQAPLKTVRAAGRSVVARWRILAQQRLDYLHELGASGRWKLYHTESDFLTMLQEAHTALKTWQELAPPDETLDKPAEVAVAQAENAEAGMPDGLPGSNLLDGVETQYDLRKL